MSHVKTDRREPVGEEIQPFLVMDILDRANALEAEGRSIIHMEAGQPGAPAPHAVREAARRALEGGKIGYTEALGQPGLRKRIAQYYGEQIGVDIAWRQIVITTGSSAGFILAFLSSLPRGAKIALAAPYYPAYPNTIRALGFYPVILRSNAASNFQMSVDLLESAVQDVDGVLIASPSNPTGGMIDDDELDRLSTYCRDRGLVLFSDEIYHGLSYTKKERSLLEYSRDGFVINSFSKYYCMTGWRIGWTVVPEDRLRSVERLSQNLYISSPTLSQLAAPFAFDAVDELNGHVRNYAQNRDFLLDSLPEIGLPPSAEPDGAFYLYCDVSRLTDSPTQFCVRMLEECGVACAPGNDFDTGSHANRVRFSYAGSHADILEAADRLARWLGSKT